VQERQARLGFDDRLYIRKARNTTAQFPVMRSENENARKSALDEREAFLHVITEAIEKECMLRNSFRYAITSALQKRTIEDLVHIRHLKTSWRAFCTKTLA